MGIIWDFSIPNALYTFVIVGLLNLYLYTRLRAEFADAVKRLFDPSITQRQLAERLSEVEEKLDQLQARGDVHRHQIDRLRRPEEGPGRD